MALFAAALCCTPAAAEETPKYGGTLTYMIPADAPLRELDKAEQHTDLLEFNKYVLDEQAHAIYLLWWQWTVPYRSYVKSWNIGPSHYVNQDLGRIWLDK